MIYLVLILLALAFFIAAGVCSLSHDMGEIHGELVKLRKEKKP